MDEASAAFGWAIPYRRERPARKDRAKQKNKRDYRRIGEYLGATVRLDFAAL
jgi:hypothetical protein